MVELVAVESGAFVGLVVDVVHLVFAVAERLAFVVFAVALVAVSVLAVVLMIPWDSAQFCPGPTVPLLAVDSERQSWCPCHSADSQSSPPEQ